MTHDGIAGEDMRVKRLQRDRIEEWNQLGPERLAANMQAEEVSASVVVRAMELGSPDLPVDVAQKLFMSNMHADHHLGRTAIESEVAFADEKTR